MYFCEKSLISGFMVNNMLDWFDDNIYVIEKKLLKKMFM